MVNLLAIIADNWLSFSLIKGEFAKKLVKNDMSLQQYRAIYLRVDFTWFWEYS